jgi:hypothetical protein
VQIDLPVPARAISAGQFECLVVLEDGTIWGWRVPFPYGGTWVSRLPGFPVQINGLRQAGAVSVGTGHALAVERKPVLRF